MHVFSIADSEIFKKKIHTSSDLMDGMLDILLGGRTKTLEIQAQGEVKKPCHLSKVCGLFSEK